MEYIYINAFYTSYQQPFQSLFAPVENSQVYRVTVNRVCGYQFVHIFVNIIISILFFSLVKQIPSSFHHSPSARNLYSGSH